MRLPEINEVRNIRNRMGLTLRDFAKKCDLSVSWINQVETGVIVDPSYIKMKKIFDMYDVERNENAKSKVIDINSEYFLIVDHKGKQVWKDWNFKKI